MEYRIEVIVENKQIDSRLISADNPQAAMRKIFDTHVYSDVNMYVNILIINIEGRFWVLSGHLKNNVLKAKPREPPKYLSLSETDLNTIMAGNVSLFEVLK